MKIHVIFDKTGTKVGDLDSMDYALGVFNEVNNTDKEVWVKVANGLVIHCFRVLVKEGRIKPYSELFFYNQETDKNMSRPIIVDKNGELSDYPLGFLDSYSDVMCKLL